MDFGVWAADGGLVVLVYISKVATLSLLSLHHKDRASQGSCLGLCETTTKLDQSNKTSKQVQPRSGSANKNVEVTVVSAGQSRLKQKEWQCKFQTSWKSDFIWIQPSRRGDTSFLYNMRDAALM